MIKTPSELMPIWLHFHHMHTQAVIVGGFVRDSLINKTCYDIDIEVFHCSDLESLLELLKPFGKVKVIGKSFGIVQLQYKSYVLDFSLPRTDSKIGKKHQDFDITYIPKATFQQAAKRRDFTVNSMGFNPITGKFLDPYNGLEDLRHKQLKAVSKAFYEDPLRVLRALQLAARLEFRIEKQTLKLCSTIVLKHLSKTRVRAEFSKLLLSRRPSFGLRYVKTLGLKKLFGLHLEQESQACDQLSLCCDAIAQSSQHFDNKTRLLLQATACCVALIHNISMNNLKKNQGVHSSTLNVILSALLNSKKQQDACVILFENFGAAHHWFKTDCNLEESAYTVLKIQDFQLLDMFKHLIQTLYPILYPNDYDSILNLFKSRLTKMVLNKPALLNGTDLITLGYKKGPEIKAIKDQLKLKQCTGEILTKKQAVTWLRNNHKLANNRVAKT